MNLTAIASLVSLLVIFYVLFGMLNAHRIDLTRQRLFEIRDELFNEGLDGHIEFQSAAYRDTRLVLNGMIRYAHRVSLIRIFVMLLVVRRGDLLGPAKIRWLAMAKPMERKLCSSYVDRANRVMVLHVLMSPFAVLLTGIVIAMLARSGIDMLSGVMKKLSGPLAEFDRMAFEEGNAHQDPIGTTMHRA